MKNVPTNIVINDNYEEHKEYWKEYYKQYRNKYPEKVLLAVKRWQNENRERYREMLRKYKLKCEEQNKGSIFYINDEFKGRSKNKLCEYCGGEILNKEKVPQLKYHNYCKRKNRNIRGYYTNKEYYSKNKTKFTEYRKKYYLKNKIKLLEKNKAEKIKCIICGQRNAKTLKTIDKGLTRCYNPYCLAEY